MVAAVLFDLDDTLFDHRSAVAAAFAAHHSEDETLLAEWRRLEDLHFAEFLAGEVTLQGQRRRRVRGLLGDHAMTDEHADAWFAAYRRHYEASWAAYEDVAPALAAIAALDPVPRLGIVTNGEASQQRAKLARLGLAERFAELIAADEVGVAKPDPAIFLLACERLGVAPAESVHVGDHLDADALGALRAGLRAVWLRRDPATGEADGVTSIASLAELAAVLQA